MWRYIQTGIAHSFKQIVSIALLGVSPMYSMGALMGVEVPRIAWLGEMHPSH